MSWTDKIALEEILKLRDEFNIETAIETGTWRGTNTELYARHFKDVYSIDIDTDALAIASSKLKSYPNVKLVNMPSWEALSLLKASYNFKMRKDIVFFYLDAHFFDPKLPPEDKWVVVKELKALKDFPNCVICIHDFDNGELGHLVYNDEHLGWNVVGEHITQINPKFWYYTNTKEWCKIYNEETISELPITVDEYVIDNIRFANSSDVKKYRGILYAVPQRLDTTKYRLIELE